MPGKVYLIGVGPGDYKLMTLKAVECIRKADVVVYDRLVNDKVLSFAGEKAERVYVGKMPDLHIVPQERINEILVEKALEGKIVARIKGGDPFVFGRGGEEAERLYEEGIEFEIVPGVTSAVAVPAYAGIPVTHRDYCSSLHIITGHDRQGREDSLINYGELAKIEGTLVFLMGVKSLGKICSTLAAHGKDKATPAAVIEKGTTREQRKVVGTLEDIASKVVEAGIESPAVTVIGGVVGLHEKLGWFKKGKLAGKKIIVTRSREQASVLVERIEELGGEALEFPTIRIEKPEDYSHFDSVLENIEQYSGAAFTSVNGVRAFFDRMRKKGIDIRKLWGIKLCAVGTATADELNRVGLNVDYMPEKYTTHEMLKGLVSFISRGDKILLARADIAGMELPEGLRELGCEVEDLVVYRTVPDTTNRDETVKLLQEGRIDCLTFTSSSTVKNFVSMLGEDNLYKIKSIKTVCIGPVTAKTAESFGMEVTSTAEVHNIEGLVDKLVECLS